MTYTKLGDTLACQGLWDRQYSPLYNVATTGTTTPKKRWEVYRCSESLMAAERAKISFHCSCCESYSKWKKTHSVAANELQKIADAPFYYAVTNEQIVVKSTSGTTVYNKTIRALQGAPQGPCTGIAFPSGKHPFTCESCYSLSTGKTIQLNRKLH